MSFPNFAKIANGTLFTTKDGGVYTKVDELVFKDPTGIEQYISPLFDRKIGTPEKPEPEVVPGATSEGEALVAPDLGSLKFADIPVGKIFELRGDKYRKTSDLTFVDGIGIEQYWSPLVDQGLAAGATTSTPTIDTSAKVVKSE